MLYSESEATYQDPILKKEKKREATTAPLGKKEPTPSVTGRQVVASFGTLFSL